MGRVVFILSGKHQLKEPTMVTYRISRWATDQNEFDTAMSRAVELRFAMSPVEAAMHAATMVARYEIQRRIAPLIAMLAAAPTAGTWEYDGIRYTITKLES